MGAEGSVAGAAGLYLVDGVALLRPEEQVFEAMLEGWAQQQLARNLAVSTVENRINQVRAFTGHADAFPWRWSAARADEWFTDLRSVRRCARSTVRGHQGAIRAFCGYLVNPAYGWVRECEERFGTHPIQVIHEWNTAVHVADCEAGPRKRAFSPAELQALFDHADEQVSRKRAAGRKGWLSAFRDATLFKIAYGYGLRRNEIRMLDAVDFGPNPHAAEFGDYGVL